MNEKNRIICNTCTRVGIVSLLVYIILTLEGTTPYLLAIRLLFAVVAAIVYAIELGVKISSKESFNNSIYLIAICLFDIIISLLQLV